MAFTAFHCAVVWPLFIVWPRRFDFIGLTVGAVIMDFYIPFTYLILDIEIPMRIITHSLIGAWTFDLLLGLIVALYIVPPLIRYLKTRTSDPRVYKFAGMDVLGQDRDLWVVIYSILIGTTSHVLVDIPYHGGSPVLYPLDSIPFPLDEILLWKIFSQGVIFLAFLYLAYKYWWARP